MRVGLVAVLLLAGCASPSGEAPVEASPEGSDASGPDATAALPSLPALDGAAPVWLPGDWWTWRFTSASHPEPRQVTTLVLAADAAGYVVGPTDLEEGLAALPTHVVPLGPVAAADLSWDAHGVPVALVDFPLADGKTWSGDLWFAPGLTYSARAADVPGPAGPEPGFAIEARDGSDVLQARANWSTARGTFLEVHYYFGAAAPFDSLVLVEQGRGRTEPGFVLEIASPYRAGAAIPVVGVGGPPPAPGGFDVADGATDVLFVCFLGGAPGTYEGALRAPSGANARCSLQNPPGDGKVVEQAVRLAAEPGAWSVALAPAGQGFAFAEAFAIAATEATPS